MQKKENRQPLWKGAAWCALCALGVYLGMQFLWAALVERGAVGEEHAQALVWASAGIAALIGVAVMGRSCRTGRMFLALGSAGALTAVVLVGTLLAGGELSERGGTLAGIGAAAMLGAAAAAAAGGKKRGAVLGGRQKRRGKTVT